MAAMKPRTGDGPMEAEREPRGLIVLRVPLEGGGRLVVSVNDQEAKDLHQVLEQIVNPYRFKNKKPVSDDRFFYARFSCEVLPEPLPRRP